MNRLTELKKDICEMTDEELRDHVSNIRRDRKMVKRSRAETKKKAVQKDEGNRKLQRLMDKMTDEERAALMKELGDEG